VPPGRLRGYGHASLVLSLLAEHDRRAPAGTAELDARAA
jgi:hypothetical protein